MDDFRLAAAIRQVRQSRGWRQVDLAERCGSSTSTISRLEQGQFGSQSIETLRMVARALEIRIDLVPRWRGGDLDRLLNRAHSAMHESVATAFAARWPAWTVVPEVMFSIYGERGSIDLLAWHPGRRALLVIELKTAIVDVNELLGTLDRKRRLAKRIALERGWAPTTVSAWLVISDDRTNRRRVASHVAMLGSALPDDRSSIHRWLRDPVGRIAALSFWTDSFWTDSHPRGCSRVSRRVRRVRAAGSSVEGRPGG